MKLSAKAASILGIIATITAIGMYVAYLPQIQMNLAGVDLRQRPARGHLRPLQERA